MYYSISFLKQPFGIGSIFIIMRKVFIILNNRYNKSTDHLECRLTMMEEDSESSSVLRRTWRALLRRTQIARVVVGREYLGTRALIIY